MSSITLIVVRHGESEINKIAWREDIETYDKANHQSPLTELGLESSIRMGERLRARFNTFDRYFVSTYIRTQQTMKAMYPTAHQLIDSRLNEIWRGVWYTLPRETMRAIFPHEETIFRKEGLYHHHHISGQSCQDVELAIYSFLQDLRINCIATDSDSHALVVGHRSWMILLWRIVCNRLADDYAIRRRSEMYQNGAMSVFRITPRKIELLEDNIAL